MGRRPKVEGQTAIAAKPQRRPPSDPSGARAASAAERERRILEVQEAIAEGDSDGEIYRWLTTEITQADVDAAKLRNLVLHVKAWKVTGNTARDYIRTAWSLALAADAANARREKTRERRMVDLVFRKAMAIAERDGDSSALRVALAAVDQRSRLNGSYDEQPTVETQANMEETEAIETIDHAYATLALARSRGVISLEQAAAAIDVDVTPAPAEPIAVEDPPPRPAPPASGPGN